MHQCQVFWYIFRASFKTPVSHLIVHVSRMMGLCFSTEIHPCSFGMHLVIASHQDAGSLPELSTSLIMSNMAQGLHKRPSTRVLTG